MPDLETLKKELTDAISRLDDSNILSITQNLIEQGCSSREIEGSLVKGIEKVQAEFESGEYFIADLIYSGMLCRTVLEFLSSSTGKAACPKKGRILIGVVKNDIHNIGKDIVASLLASDGFEVIDLGSDVSSAEFIEAIRRYSPQIVLLSGMMHFAKNSMKQTLEAIEEAGLRHGIHVLLGGGCVDSDILNQIDADDAVIDPLDTLNRCNHYITGGTDEK
ncbi:MAG: hypothetical protein HFI64_13015 [Lachnospiraceae bacterium]|nr:hypothetical protein [Lachnospiraceae bacterium]